MSRWLAVLSPVTTFVTLSGRKKPFAPPVPTRWETAWAADGPRILRVLKSL